MLGTDSIGCRIFIVLGFDLRTMAKSHPQKKWSRKHIHKRGKPWIKHEKGEVHQRRCFSLAIFSWNDWEVPEQRQCAGVWWNKARPSTNHQLASDFQGGKAQQNSIMLQVFEAELLTFRTKKQSYRASDNGREKVSKTSFQRSKALERLKGSYGHVGHVLISCSASLYCKTNGNGMPCIGAVSS